MNRYTLDYLDELRCELVHKQSETVITTDAPTDNNGKGESFSPTDLLTVSLASCMVTIMGIQAQKSGWDMGNVKADIKKTMISGPRRISGIDIIIDFKSHNLSKNARIILENAALNCPVAKSISTDITTNVKFNYD